MIELLPVRDDRYIYINLGRVHSHRYCYRARYHFVNSSCEAVKFSSRFPHIQPGKYFPILIQ